MLKWISGYLGISVPIATAIVALGVIQLTLQIWALVDLIRRPGPGQRKVVFAAVIVVLGLIGAIAYLAVGRSMLDESESDIAAGSNEAARKRALDQLYGSDDRR